MHHYSKVLIKLLQKGTSAPVQKEKKKKHENETCKGLKWCVTSHNTGRSKKISRNKGNRACGL